MTIPYLELPVAMLDKDQKETTAKLKIYPPSIIAYLEQGNYTNIYTEGGQSFLLALNIADYEAMIQKFYKLSAQSLLIKSKLTH